MVWEKLKEFWLELKWNVICKDIIEDYEKEIRELRQKNSDLFIHIANLETKIEDLKDKLKEMKEKEKKAKELENLLNSKYPKKTVLYKGRYTINKGWRKVDVRDFFINPNSYELQETLKKIGIKKNESDDRKAEKIQKWVVRNIRYVSDKANFGLPEYWMYPQETLTYKKSDCDDGSILIANLLLASGIPYYKIRVVCGYVYDKKGNLLGGHAYCVYYCEKTKKWVALDWCFYPDLRPIEKREDYKKEKIYGGENSIWFSFNQKFAFSTLKKGKYSYFEII